MSYRWKLNITPSETYAPIKMECALEFLIENAPTVVTTAVALSPQTYLPTIDFELHLTISLHFTQKT